MAPLRKALLLPLLPFTLVVGGRSGGKASVSSLIALEPTPPLQQSTHHDASSARKLHQDEGGGATQAIPLSQRDTGEPQQQRRRRSRWGSKKRPPFTALLAGAAANAGEGLRARAQRLGVDVHAGAVAVAAAVSGDNRRRGGGVAGSTRGGRHRRRDTWLADSLAFGIFLKPAEMVEQEEAVSEEMLALQAENDASVAAVLAVIDSEGWEYVTSKSGVVVVKKFLPPPPSSSREQGEGVVDAGAAAKFACVKAMGTLDADATELYKLFLDNERVHEYNDNCREVRDLERLSPDTKVSWAATPKYGPFKARDFVTMVHYRTLEDGTMVVVNRPVEHSAARRSKKYVRAEILIATNIMRPNREDPTKTDFISVTHINPGGIADSRLGAKLVNKLCAKAPVSLLVALEKSANSAPVPKATKVVA